MVFAPTFYAYLHTPDTKFNPSLAYQLIRVYEKYVLELEVDQTKLLEVGYSKLDILKDVVTKENVYGKLEEAIPLGRSDLRIERDSGGTTLYEENEALYSKFYVWGIMEDGFESLIKRFPEHKVDFILIREQFLKLEAKING